MFAISFSIIYDIYTLMTLCSAHSWIIDLALFNLSIKLQLPIWSSGFHQLNGHGYLFPIQTFELDKVQAGQVQVISIYFVIRHVHTFHKK